MKKVILTFLACAMPLCLMAAPTCPNSLDSKPKSRNAEKNYKETPKRQESKKQEIKKSEPKKPEPSKSGSKKSEGKKKYKYMCCKKKYNHRCGPRHGHYPRGGCGGCPRGCR